jgi:hypothetical protein
MEKAKNAVRDMIDWLAPGPDYRVVQLTPPGSAA